MPWARCSPTSSGRPAFEDSDSDDLTYSAVESGETTLPSWLTFTESTRTFSGTPTSSDAGTLTVTVTADDRRGGTVSDSFDIVVNTPPTASNGEVTTNEDTAYAFAAGDFNFADADTGDALAGVRITSLPANGALSHDGTAVYVNQLVSRSDIDAGVLKYTPPENANGDDYTTFMFKVNDGSDDSSSAYTMTVDVTAVNDAPVVANEIPDQGATVSTSFSYTVPANTFTDAETATLTYGATKGDGTALPTWLSFNATSRTFSGTTPSSAETVTVKVTAGDGPLATATTLKAEDSFDIVVRTSTSTAPAKVTGVTVTARSGALRVAWTAVTGADGYLVEWKSGTQAYGSSRQADVTSGTTVQHDISPLMGGTAYTVRVTAYESNTDGPPSFGPASDEATGTPNKVTASVHGFAARHLANRLNPTSAVSGRIVVHVRYLGVTPAGLGTDDLTVTCGSDCIARVHSVERVSGNSDYNAAYEVEFIPKTSGNSITITINEDAITQGNSTGSNSTLTTAAPFTFTMTTDAAEPVTGDFTVTGTFSEGALVEVAGEALVQGMWPKDLVPAPLTGIRLYPLRFENASIVSQGSLLGFKSAPFANTFRIRPAANSRGTLTVTLPAGEIVPSSGGQGHLEGRSSNRSVFRIKYDTRTDQASPEVTSIERQTPSSSPTNADSLTWRVTFDEDVKDVDAADFAVSGTTGTLSVSEVTASSVYDVTATGGDLAGLNGTVTLSFAAGQDIKDTDDNELTNTTPTGTNEADYVVDNTAPTVTSIERQTPAATPTNADSLTWRVTFNENMKDVGMADFAVSGVTGATLSVSEETASTVFDVTVTGGDLATLNATATLSFAAAQDIKDAAGNALTSTTPTGTNEPDYVVDNTAPAFSSATVNGTTMVITMSEDLAAAGSLAGAAFTVERTPQGSTEETVSVSGSPAIGGATVTLTLAATVASTDTDVKVSYAKPGTGTDNRLADAAGNETASFTDQPVTITTNSAATGAPEITGTARVGEVLTAGQGTIADANGLPATFPDDYAFQWVRVDGTDSDITGADSQTYTLQAADVGKTVKVRVSFTDGGGSPEALTSEAFPADGTILTDDDAAPRVASVVRHSPASSPTNADSLAWRVTFSEDVKDVDAADFAVAGTTATLAATEATASTVFDVTASGGDLAGLNGTVTLSFAAGQDIKDTADNALVDTAPTGTNEPDYVVDNTAPTFSSAAASGTSLVVAFNEGLGPASGLANTAFTVERTPQGGSEEEVSLSGTPSINGSAVTLTLADAIAATDANVKVSYEKPGTGTGNKIVDVAGNEAASFTDRAVSTAPLVQSMTVSPVPPGAGKVGELRCTKRDLDALPDDAVHGPGATLTFTLTLDRDVTVTPASGSEALPALALDVFKRGRRASYAGPVGSPTRTLTFEWTVGRGDYDPDGLGVRGLVLNGATVRDAEGRELASVPARQFGAHRVRGGYFAVRLDGVDGPAREGEPFTVRVARDGGFGQRGLVFAAATDSAVDGNGNPTVHPAGIDLAPQGATLASGEAADGRSGFWRVTPQPDGQADAARTLTFRLQHAETGCSGGAPPAWYDIGTPSEATVTVADAGIGSAADAPGLSVGPAGAAERNAGRYPMTFRVCLWTGSLCPDEDRNPAFEAYGGVGHEVRVGYATRDGTATEGADYVATSGTLVFAPGETVKTVDVELLPDNHDEGTETVWLELSNPVGAAIERGRNFGMIYNDGPIPKAWIARFGRSVSEQVLDAVEGRMRGPRAPGAEMNLGGRRIGLGPLFGGPGSGAGEAGQTGDTGGRTREGNAVEETASGPAGELAGRGTGRTRSGPSGERAGQGDRAAGERDAGALTADEVEEEHRAADPAAWLRGWPGQGSGSGAGWAGAERQGFGAHAGPADRGHSIDGRDLLLGSSFSVTAEAGGGGFVSLWGRSAVTRFDGREDTLSLDGEVTSAMLGTDWSRGPWTAGLLVSHSLGDGGYSGGAPGWASGAAGESGTIEAELTGLYPWLRHALSDRLEAWGVAGIGAGRLTLRPGGAQAIRTDLDLWMAAAGLRGTVLNGGGGLTLVGKTDALILGTSTAEVSGPGGNLAAAEAEVTRLRLALEASRPVMLGASAVLTPSLEVGLRQDGGDAESGYGLDLGGGLTLFDPDLGLESEVRGRGLLSHESKGFRERGFSGALSWKQRPFSDRGAALTLTQTVGGSPSGGGEALFGQDTLEGLAADDGGDDLEDRRLEALFGYGFSVSDDRFTLTPEFGLGLSPGQREYRLGWRLVERAASVLAFETGLELTRREQTGAEGPEHDVLLGFGWRLEGAEGRGLELRVDLSGRQAANDNARPEAAIGVGLTARW